MFASTEHGRSLTDQVEGWQLRPDQVNYAWEQMLPLIEDTLKHSRGECSVKDIYVRLQEGTMQAFAVARNEEIELLVLTEFVDYPQYRTVRLVLLAGRQIETIKEFIPAFENWALMNGAVEIEAWVRPSMARFTKQKQFGFEQAYIGMRKDLRRSLQ